MYKEKENGVIQNLYAVREDVGKLIKERERKRVQYSRENLNIFTELSDCENGATQRRSYSRQLTYQ